VTETWIVSGSRIRKKGDGGRKEGGKLRRAFPSGAHSCTQQSTRRNAKGNLQLTAYNSRVSSISLKPKNKEQQKDINPKRKVNRHKKIANQDRTAALLQISFSPPPNTSFLSLLFTLRTHSVGFLRNPSFTLNCSDQSRNETKRNETTSVSSTRR